jgi:uncharacterized repeat protein (TIGR02543 family)
LAALSLVAVSPARADLLISESFEYPAAQLLDGKTGGIGFSDQWVEAGTPDDQIQAGSLSLGIGQYPGNSVATNAGLSGYSDLSRDVVNIPGEPAKVLWAGFLLRKTSAVTTSQDDYFGLTLYSSDSGLFIGKPSERNTWGLATSGSPTAAGGDSGVAVVQNQTVFLVAKITFASGNDTIQLFVNPPIGGTAPTTPVATKNDIDLDQIDAIGVLAGEAAWSFDEIRVATSYADVAPGSGRAGIFSFSAPQYRVTENRGSATVTVTRANDSAGPVTVRCSTVAGGTAGANADYTEKSEVLSFGQGVKEKTFTISIATNDVAGELAETINLKLSEPSSGTALGAIPTAVLSILPPDLIKPKLVVVKPAAGLVTSDASVEVSGTTSDASGVVAVLVQRGAGGFYDPFQAADGTTTWKKTVTLVPGLNTIRVKAVDEGGNESLLATRTVTYVLMSPLTVNAVPPEGGTVPASFAGTHDLQVAKSYSITAVPAVGWVFDGWTGDASGELAKLTFTMKAMMHLQAHFVVNPFIPVAGAYRGLINASSPAYASSGWFALKLGPTGALTGKIVLGGVSFPIVAVLDNHGVARFGLGRAKTLILPNTSLTLALNYNLAAGTVTGSILEPGGFTTAIKGQRQTFSATLNPVAEPLRGKYTVLFPPNPANAGATYPQGNGWATLTVSIAGVAKLNGVLADGAPIVWSGSMLPGPVLPLYVPLYANKGSISGLVTFRNKTGSDLDGLALQWFRPPDPDPAAVRYKNGWMSGIKIDLIGSNYIPPSTEDGTKILPGLGATNSASGNMLLTLSGGGLSTAISRNLDVTALGLVKVLAQGTEKPVLTIASTTGVFSGTFLPATGSASRALKGVLFQKQNRGAGFFPGTSESGPVKLTLK